MRVHLQESEQRGAALLPHFSAFLGEGIAWQVWRLQLCLRAPLAAAPGCHHGQGFEVSSAWEGSWAERGPTVLWLIPPQWFFIGCGATTWSSLRGGLVVGLSLSGGGDTSSAFPSRAQ